MRYLCALAFACVALAQTVIIDGSAGQGGTAVITPSSAVGTGIVGRPPWGGNFTYYVDSATGSDSNPGTLALPFQTVSKVNGLTLTAGQSVGFKRGGMWREMLTPGQSGTAGGPITFGAYGTGAKPIITGADPVAGTWTTARVTQFADTLNHNGTNGSWTKTGTGTNFASGQFQVVMTATTGTHRISYTYNASPPSEVWCTYQVLIPSGFSVPNNSGGYAGGFYNSSTGNAEGAVGYHNTAGTLFWEGVYNDNTSVTSSTVLTTDVTHTVLIHVIAGGGGIGLFTYWIDGVQVGNSSGLTNNVHIPDQALLGMNFTGNTVTISANYSNFAIYSATDNPNVWKTAMTTEPHMLAFNSTTMGPGAIGGMPTSYNSVDENWYWTGNVLYLVSSSIPSSRFTSLEAGARASAIDTVGKSHIVIDGLSLQKANGIINGAVTIGSSSDWRIQNSELAYNANAGVYITSVAGGSLLVNNNSIHDNAYGVLSYQYTGAGVGTEAVISNNNIANNTYHNYGATWVFPEAIQMYGNYMVAEYNTVSNNGNLSGDSIGIHIYTGDGDTAYGQHNTVRYNVISGEISNGSDGSAIELDHTAQNNLVSFNVAYGNHGPCIDMFGVPSNAIYNNTCYNNFQNPTFPIGKGEILISSNGSSTASSSNLIKNNLVYATQNGTYGIYAADAASLSNTISNNLLYDSGQANWYFWNPSGGATLATFNAFSGVSGNLNADPLFSNAGSGDFTLQPGSPAIGTGVFISGVSTANPPNIGAK